MSKEVLRKRNDGSVEIQRGKCGVLPLVLCGKWFDMIDSGIKKVEFRRAEYWLPRASKWLAKCQRENLWPVLEFRHGYSTDARRAAFLAGIVLDFKRGLVHVCENGRFAVKDADDAVENPEIGETAINRVCFFIGTRVHLVSARKSIK